MAFLAAHGKGRLFGLSFFYSFFVFDQPGPRPCCVGVGVPGPTGQQAPCNPRFPVVPVYAHMRTVPHMCACYTQRCGSALPVLPATDKDTRNSDLGCSRGADSSRQAGGAVSWLWGDMALKVPKLQLWVEKKAPLAHPAGLLSEAVMCLEFHLGLSVGSTPPSSN